MNPSNGLIAGMLAVVSILAVLGLTPYGAATTPDSMRYLEVARNLRDGEGLVMTNPGVGARLVPFTTYAPLYPYALAPFLQPELPAERAAARFAVLASWTSAWLVFLLLADRHRGIALAAAVTWCLCQPAIAVFTYAWSETLAVPLVLAMVFALDRCARAVDAGGSRAALWLAAATVALCLLLGCRYAAWPLAALLPATWLMLRERRRWVWDFAAASAAVAGIAAALVVRNWRLTGYVSGAPRESAAQGLAANAADFFVALFVQFPQSAFSWGVAVAVGVAAAVTYRTTNGGDDRSGSRVASLCALALGVYYGGIVVLRSMRDFDEIDTRFVALVFPLALVLLVRVTVRWGRIGRALLALSFVLLAWRGVETYSWAVSSHALRGSPKIPLTAGMEYANYNRPGRALLAHGGELLERGRYLEALVQLDRAIEVCEDRYALARALATVHAGLGNAEESLEWTHECFADDPERAAEDTVVISRPFWDDPSRYRAGIDYYEGLLEDLPDAPWLHRNIEALARRVGDFDRAESARARAEALE